MTQWGGRKCRCTSMYEVYKRGVAAAKRIVNTGVGSP